MIARLIGVVVGVVGLTGVARGVEVTLSSDYPGGNLRVLRQEDTTIQVAPDLRGGASWFYWNFEAHAAEAGRVSFVFANPPQIGVRGPAISRDQGRTWDWLGTEEVDFAPPRSGDPRQVREERFHYTFTAGERVRFAVAIPYVQQDLERFLASVADNPHLRRSPLARTRGGLVVELLEVGAPSADKRSMLVTARHHACESMASYVLEGLLRETLADSAAGRAFRERFHLCVVPIVDLDGVQAGDQGKNRSPHDHNRDYGPEPLYPEIRAIQELGERYDIAHTLDLHCPALRGDIHEAFHFLGLGLPHTRDNLNELIDWLREERPQIAMAPLNFLTDAQKPNAINPRINSHHFALRPGSVFAATLEIPYAQPVCPLDQDLARAYGASIVRAWIQAQFLPADQLASRTPSLPTRLHELRGLFSRSYRGQPQEMEQRALALQQSDSPVERVEGGIQLATLRLHQRQFDAALEHCASVLRDERATTTQRAAATLLKLQCLAARPDSMPGEVADGLAEALRLPYPANDLRAKLFDTVAKYHAARQEYSAAIEQTRRQRETAASHEQGQLLNRIASYHDQLKQPADALVARREAVALLRRQLDPVPGSVFGGIMVVELFDALQRIPDSTAEERQAAAQLVFDHAVVSAAVKQRVRQALATERPAD